MYEGQNNKSEQTIIPSGNKTKWKLDQAACRRSKCYTIWKLDLLHIRPNE